MRDRKRQSSRYLAQHIEAAHREQAAADARGETVDEFRKREQAEYQARRVRACKEGLERTSAQLLYWEARVVKERKEGLKKLKTKYPHKNALRIWQRGLWWHYHTIAPDYARIEEHKQTRSDRRGDYTRAYYWAASGYIRALEELGRCKAAKAALEAMKNAE